MVHQDKYFDQDKNSILRAAQGFVEPQLINVWIETALESYMRHENPMGLVDDFVQSIQDTEQYDSAFLPELYALLSAIYRLKKGNNQLEFIWDGRSHYEVYAENWSTQFEEWTYVLCERPEVYRSILKACILQQGTNSKFLYYAVRRVLLDHFSMKFTRKKLVEVA